MKKILPFLLCIFTSSAFAQAPPYEPLPESVGLWMSFNDTLYSIDRVENEFIALSEYRPTNNYLNDSMFREYRWIHTAKPAYIVSAWAYQWRTPIKTGHFFTPKSPSQQHLIQSLRREVDSLTELLKKPADTLLTYRMVSCTLKSTFWNQIDNSLYTRKVYKVTYADGSVKYLDLHKKPFRPYYKIWEYQ